MDLTSNIAQIQQLLGIDGWQIQPCRYSFVDSNGNNQLVTFLDMETLLGIRDFSPNLQASPLLNAILQGVEDPDSLPFLNIGQRSAEDNSGNTWLRNSNDRFINRIAKYKVPGGGVKMQYWGNEQSEVSLHLLLTGNDYEYKLRYLLNNLRSNTGSRGGTLQHPIYGDIDEVFVESMEVVTGEQFYKASIVNVKFIFGGNDSIVSEPESRASRINRILNDIRQTLNILGSTVRIRDQISALAPSAFSVPSFTSRTPLIITESREGNTSTEVARATEIEQDRELSNAIFQLERAGTSTDRSLSDIANELSEQCCYINNVEVQGFGKGELRSTSTSEFSTSEPSSLVNRTRIRADGTIERTYYETTGFSTDTGDVTVRETVEIANPVRNLLSVDRMKNKYNEATFISTVLSTLNQDKYNDYSVLLSRFRELVELADSSGNVKTITLDKDYTVQGLAAKYNMDTNQLLRLNFDKISFHKKLQKGMEIRVVGNVLS